MQIAPLRAATAPPISVDPEVRELLGLNAPVAMGISGGKDSAAVAFATCDYLDNIGHTGPRLLIHSDLGAVEWRDSLPACERLADHLGVELAVVRRPAGGMMERWESRWKANVDRYVNLKCVKMILPWSTPSMRFCTSELKTDVICRELVRRFPGRAILSVSGIRAEESARRALAPISKPQKKLENKTHGTRGLDWHSILTWSKADVFAYLRAKGFPLHEAYTAYGCSRVSCTFCIMAAAADLRAAATCADNAEIYGRMCELEISSTFSFQEGGWLSDVAPHLLTRDQLRRLPRAKSAAKLREKAESIIPAHLLYTKGWPTCIPTQAEAELLCTVRQTVAATLGIEVLYTEPAGLIGRYEELQETKDNHR
ncbi:MAG: phosphoadenosine phosphosulfate reductase family protein [Capsulimonas sp.]|uniref:phosphoadenosine phosphosulfate reductase family protein n=1 Tax=Capsulimonas sp. TaxID=2494211 RepID=UPI003263922C